MFYVDGIDANKKPCLRDSSLELSSVPDRPLCSSVRLSAVRFKHCGSLRLSSTIISQDNFRDATPCEWQLCGREAKLARLMADSYVRVYVVSGVLHCVSHQDKCIVPQFDDSIIIYELGCCGWDDYSPDFMGSFEKA